MTCKSMDIRTVTKAAGKGTKDLHSNYLFSTNECKEFNHSNKESGRPRNLPGMLLPLKGGNQIGFPIIKLE